MSSDDWEGVRHNALEILVDAGSEDHSSLFNEAYLSDALGQNPYRGRVSSKDVSKVMEFLVEKNLVDVFEVFSSPLTCLTVYRANWDNQNSLRNYFGDEKFSGLIFKD